MKSVALTERRIRDLQPGPKPSFLWDKQLPGFGVRCTKSGTKSFVFWFRADNGRKSLATLGRCAEISLKVARERAADELGRIRAGDDDLLTRREARRDAPTVNDGIDRFLDVDCPARIELGRMAPKTRKDYHNQARKYLRPAIGNRKAADVSRHDVERMVKGLPPVMRNRVLALVSRLFNLFETWEWRDQHTNPCRGIERAREHARDRTLSPDEMAALASALKAAESRHPGPVAAIRLAALTGLRISEVLNIRWTDVDFQTGRLTLPETKTGARSHDMPSAALELMQNLSETNDFICTTGRGRMSYARVRKVFADVAKAAGLNDVRLHDLRRTVMTRAAMAGVGTHVLRDLLGHKTTTMADRYIRQLGTPVRDAREAVGATMAAMMAGDTADVVNIDKSA